MALKAFREVGDCGCHESQAGKRMRELVRSLQDEVRDARRVIDELVRARGSREKTDASSAKDHLTNFDWPPVPAGLGRQSWIRPY